jgi:hypothetical protein
MKGCLKGLGCMVLLVLVTCGAAWYSRDWWLPKVGLKQSQQVARAPWEGATDAGAKRADVALRQLQTPRGPAFANLSAGDLLSYLVKEIGRQMPKSADSLSASVVGDRLYVRFSLKTSDLSKDMLGPLGSFVRERERVVMGGTLNVIKPGLTELQVKDVAIGSLRLPQATIPTLLNQLGTDRPAGIAKDGVAFATPPYIGDVRVANGKITVYKKT